jgi:hypothetical protein
MRPKRHAHRPDLADSALEARLVLSHYNSPIPDAIVNANITQFRDQYTKLKTELTAAVDSTLLGGNNLTPTPATRASYDALVQTEILNAQTTLTNVLALSPLAHFKFTPQVQDILNGTGSTSLQSKLAAIPTPTATGAPVTAFTNQTVTDIKAALDASLNDLYVFVSRDNPLRQNLGDFHVDPVSALSQSYTTQLNSLFSTAQTNYTTAVTGTLLAGTDPTAIAGQRPAFDAQVKTIVTTLNADFADMLALSPGAAAALTAQVDSLLLSGSNSLLSQLDGLTTPTDLNGTTAQAFQTSATADFQATETSIQTLLNRYFSGQTLAGLFA